MDKIFTQEELYWLDDILPGSNQGRIRRASITRNVQMPKTDVNQKLLNSNLADIVEVCSISLSSKFFVIFCNNCDKISKNLSTPVILLTEV